MEPDDAELSLRKRRNRLLDVFPAETSRSADAFVDAGMDPGKHGLEYEETASDGGHGLKSKPSGMEKVRLGLF